jgi:gamma-glutamyl-gamma-aminobutyrate hydrolase PuuD
MQLLNVHLGGTLHQKLATEPLDHGAPGDSRSHQVRIEQGSRLWDACGRCEEIGVISAHRQAVKVLGQGLVVTARAPDGLVEAFELAGGEPVVAVQWHPEAAGADPTLYRFVTELA